MASFILLGLFVLLPMAELAVLLRVADAFGWMDALGIVILTGVVGAFLARQQGLAVLLGMQRDLAEGRMPAPRILDGVMILVAGALLITPGLITDTLGFLLLVPAVRAALRGWLRRKLEQKLRQGSASVEFRF